MLRKIAKPDPLPILEQFWAEAVQEVRIEGKAHPTVIIPNSPSLEALAKLRQRDWGSTSRWNPKAESTGLLGELAWHLVTGQGWEVFKESFLAGLQGGDAGYDLVLESGDTVDVKSTGGDGQWFRFSQTNRFRGRAAIVAFAHVGYGLDEVWIRCVGWSWWHALKPYLREKGGREILRFASILRDGLVQPAYSLNDVKG